MQPPKIFRTVMQRKVLMLYKYSTTQSDLYTPLKEKK